MSVCIGLIDICTILIMIAIFVQEKTKCLKVCVRCCPKLCSCFSKGPIREASGDGNGEDAARQLAAKVTSSTEEKKQSGGGDDDDDGEVDNVTIEMVDMMAEMVGSPIASGSPIRMQDVTVALPSPAKKKSLGGKKVGDADAGGVAMPSVMHFNGDKKNATIATLIGKGILLKTRNDGTEMIQLSWKLANNSVAILYRPCQTE